MPVLRLICDRDWRADADRLEESLRQELRHPNAAVGSGIAREIASMHSDPSVNAHKIRHGCAFEMSAGRLRIDPQLYIWLYHVISGIYVITVFGRNMVHILLLNCEMSDWGVQSFAPSGKLGDACQFSALIKIGALLAETDFHARFSAHVLTIPIGNIVLRGTG